jgi:methylmalonyl-CoA decarboxylase subunit alpha
MAWEKKLADLRRRRAKALQGGGEERYERHRASGKLTARERLAYLLDENSFNEIGLLAHSDIPGEAENTPADSKITGFGKIGGHKVGVVATDFTVKAATSSRVGSKKELTISEMCEQKGMPFVYLGEAGGARMPDIMGAVGLATIGGYHANSRDFLTGLTRPRNYPMAVAILGDAFGEPTWKASLADYVVMTKAACMAISGPRVLEIATNEKVDPAELGGWELHTMVTGLADDVANDDREAIDLIKRFLSYLPSHSEQRVPVMPVPPGSGENIETIADLLPEKSGKVYDMLHLIERIVDKDSVFQIKKRFGKSLITCFARVGGETVGIVANQPRQLGGGIDTDAIDKAISFLCLCDSFNIPLIFMHDTPGFIVGPAAERRRAPAKIIAFLEAMGQLTVPKITLLIRKSYGMAFYNMGGTGTGITFSAAWPSAEISFVSEKIGVNVVYGRQIQSAPDPAAEREKLEEFMRNENSPYSLAGLHLIHDVIEPSETRAYLLRCLELAYDERTSGIGQHKLANWPKKI